MAVINTKLQMIFSCFVVLDLFTLLLPLCEQQTAFPHQNNL